MNGVVPFRMFPALAVEGTSTMLPAGVTVDCSVVMREALSSTAVFTALKLAFTSDALAGVPEVKVVSGPTGPACPSPTHANSAAIHRIFGFAFMTYPLEMEVILAPSCTQPQLPWSHSIESQLFDGGDALPLDPPPQAESTIATPINNVAAKIRIFMGPLFFQ